jgi:hypothetical protein
MKRVTVFFVLVALNCDCVGACAALHWRNCGCASDPKKEAFRAI